ncbi:phage baseplate assembly protein V [Salmonella enterica]
MVEKRKKTRSTSSSVDLTTRYAMDVASGKEIAGPDIRNSCKRHLKDLESCHARGLVWDTVTAQRAIDFFAKVLKLNGGEHEGKPFNLLPWQCFIVGSVFGWQNSDGYRRFRMVYVESGKGSGKSPLAAGIALYCLVADREPRAEVYAAATKKDQAMILFRDAVAMVDQSPALAQRINKSGGAGKEWNLAFLQTGSFFRPISSDDGQSGPRPHCALIDEIHEHKNNQVVEMMRAGTKGRRQALIFMITNSGHDKTSVCYDYHEYGRKVAEGSVDDDSFFSFICSLDEGEDPFKDETCWKKANHPLQNMVTRAVITAIDTVRKCQTAGLKLIAGEKKENVEHLEPYGFTSAAQNGAEAVVLFPGGDRSHGVAVVVADRRFRLKGLARGEVALYDDQGQSVTLTRAGIVINGGGKPVIFTNATKARFEMPIESTGDIRDNCDSSGKTMAEMRTTYNGHTHKENGDGGGITDKPGQPMS